MRCPRCDGYLYRDQYRVLTCINCARPLLEVQPLEGDYMLEALFPVSRRRTDALK